MNMLLRQSTSTKSLTLAVYLRATAALTGSHPVRHQSHPHRHTEAQSGRCQRWRCELPGMGAPRGFQVLVPYGAVRRVGQ